MEATTNSTETTITRTYEAYVETFADGVTVERSVPTGDEYDGSMYRFIFPGDWSARKISKWMRAHDFYPNGVDCMTAAGEGTSMNWSKPASYAMGNSLTVLIQMAYPGC